MKTINRVLSAYVQLRVQNNQAAHIITICRLTDITDISRIHCILSSHDCAISSALSAGQLIALNLTSIRFTVLLYIQTKENKLKTGERNKMKDTNGVVFRYCLLIAAISALNTITATTLKNATN